MPAATTYPSGSATINATVFEPSAIPNGRVIILAHGSDGYVDTASGPWRTMMDLYGAELAKQQFRVIVPHYFDKTGTSAGDLDLSDQLNFIRQVAEYRSPWQQAISDSVSYFADPNRFPGIDPSRVGLIGFSLGGHLCARLAGICRALSIYFAPILDGLDLSNTLPSLRVEIHHGAADFLTYGSNAVKIDDAFKLKGASSKLWPAYPGAVHGFVGSDAENASARADSLQRTKDFMAAEL